MSDDKKEIKTKSKKSPKVQNADLREKNLRNTNLRLIKNGDKQVEKQAEESKEAKEAEVPKPAVLPPQEEKKEKTKDISKDKKTTNKTANKTANKTINKKKNKKGKKKKATASYKKEKTRVKNHYGMDRPALGEWFLQNRSIVVVATMILVIAIAFAAVGYYILTYYKVTTVYVDGNIHYNNEEVTNMVMTGRYGNNSLYLAMKYRNKGIEGIPFVEKMDINILSPNTIRISVYEKALAGYVEYLGRYMYFDKDGIVVESAEVTTAGIPQVTGLDFDYIILGEPLPVENDEIFKKVLSITQLLNKYELSADKIFFGTTFDLTLYFDKIKVTLGSSENLDEKIMKLQYILPKLEGKSGTLPMNNYTEDTKIIPFNPD